MSEQTPVTITVVRAEQRDAPASWRPQSGQPFFDKDNKLYTRLDDRTTHCLEAANICCSATPLDVIFYAFCHHTGGVVQFYKTEEMFPVDHIETTAYKPALEEQS